MSTHDEVWSEFTHTTQSSSVTAHELLQRYREFKDVLADLPRKELINRGWLVSLDDLSPLATLIFDLPITKQATLFRKTAKADEILLEIWLARARAQAEYLCLAEERPDFIGLNKEDLRRIAQLSVDPHVIRNLPSILASFGIILVYVYALPGMSTDGAVFHLSSGHPVIALSLRFPRMDYFWFTLLHELAHLVLHAGQLNEPVFYDVESGDEDRIEMAANRLAKESIADRESWRNCPPKYNTSDRAVYDYAAEQGVHPSLIAGLIRKEFANYKRYNSIINEQDVRKILFQS